jgi:hypothetical protein
LINSILVPDTFDIERYAQVGCGKRNQVPGENCEFFNMTVSNLDSLNLKTNPTYIVEKTGISPKNIYLKVEVIALKNPTSSTFHQSIENKFE